MSTGRTLRDKKEMKKDEPWPRSEEHETIHGGKGKNPKPRALRDAKTGPNLTTQGSKESLREGEARSGERQKGLRRGECQSPEGRTKRRRTKRRRKSWSDSESEVARDEREMGLLAAGRGQAVSSCQAARCPQVVVRLERRTEVARCRCCSCRVAVGTTYRPGRSGRRLSDDHFLPPDHRIYDRIYL